MRTAALLTTLTLLLAACGDKDTGTTGGDDTGETTPDAVDADADGFDTTEDCDDNASLIFPGAEEICDGIDNNCDGVIDEGVTTTYYNDADGDGYGDEASATDACSAPSGTIEVAGDCDDTNASTSPDGKEFCDEVDNNCDGFVDEFVTDTFYLDADGDGYGDAKQQVEACEAPSGYTADYTDCDDTDAALSPGATETCDGIDTDCDLATTDEGTVSWTDGKTTVDLTAEFAAGTSAAPAQILLEDAGDITLCGGSWYVDLDITADVNIFGEGGSELNELNGGGLSSIIAYPSSGPTSWIEGVTLTGGAGFYDKNFSRTVGGAVRCTSGATVSMDDVIISDSTASVGGGVFVYDCDMDFTDSYLLRNAAEYGGGMFIYAGEVSFNNATVSDNSADYTAGGIMAQGSAGDVLLDLVDTQIIDNYGAYAGGLAAIYASDITCSSTKGGAQRGAVTGNSTSGSYAGGVFLQYYDSTYGTYYKGYSVSVSDCDFGEAKGSNDNSPTDVYSYDQLTGYTDYGDGTSFYCDYYGCK